MGTHANEEDLPNPYGLRCRVRDIFDLPNGFGLSVEEDCLFDTVGVADCLSRTCSRSKVSILG